MVCYKNDCLPAVARRDKVNPKLSACRYIR